MIELLNFGAGVQSTTVLLMSLEGELPPLDYVVFADTGWEPQAVYANLKWLQSLVKIHVVSAGNIRDDHTNPQTKRQGLRSTIPFYVDTGGKREGRTFRKCTREYKIDPINKWVRQEVLKLKPRQRAPKKVVNRWYGISYDEIQRMRQPKERWEAKNWYPLVERRMTRQNCLEWCRSRAYPEPPRSACLGCPFRSNLEWLHLKETDSGGFENAAEFDETCRTHAALKGDAYLHRSLVPLRDVQLVPKNGDKQPMLWEDECEGLCGV